MSNGVRATALFVVVFVVFVVVGSVVAGRVGTVTALLLAVVISAVAYVAGGRIALAAGRARPVSEVEYPALHRIVRELCTAARRSMPRLYVSPMPQPNAFAVGRGPRSAAVCCTVGLLRLLDERELRAAIAHELSHVHNRDILVSSVTGALAAVVTWLAGLAWFLPLGDDEDGPGLVGMLLMVVLGPVAAMVVRLAVSRSREFTADTAGARLSGDPLGLASALRKIDKGIDELPFPDDGRLTATGHMMIANPFRGEGVVRLFSTHPPVADRIAHLEWLAGPPR